MKVRLLVVCGLMFLLIDSKVLKAEKPISNSQRLYSSKFQSRQISDIDSTVHKFEKDRMQHWRIGLPVWIPGYSGQFTVGGIEVGGEPDGDFWERLFSSETRLDFYFVGLINYNWQQWDFQANVFSGSIRNSTVFTLDDNRVVNASLDMWMPNLLVAYDFLYNSASLGPITNWRAYLGSRLYNFDIEINLPNRSGVKEGNTSWLTLFFGTQLDIKIIEGLTISLSGDIGGFFDSGKPDLFGSTSVHYRPWDLFSVSIGYAAIRIVKVRNNSQDIGIKATLAGPVLGIAFHF
jgi:hypothetical protein